MRKNKSNLIPNHSLELDAGQYLAPEYSIREFGGLLSAVTSHKTFVPTGKMHHHKKPMLSYVLYGGNKEFRNGQTLFRETGNLSFYEPFEVHSNQYLAFPSKHLSLELDDAFFAETSYSVDDIKKGVDHKRDETFFFVRLLQEMVLNDSQSKTSVEMAFISFLEHSLGNQASTTTPSWINLLRELLNDRWNESFSLHEIADEVVVHPTTISKNFKRFFGCTYGEYMRKLKIKRAIGLMGQQHHSLTEIAYLCGFSDQSHFTRTFKSIIGFLPKEFLKIQ